jgi:hypothetical protein
MAPFIGVQHFTGDFSVPAEIGFLPRCKSVASVPALAEVADELPMADESRVRSALLLPVFIFDRDDCVTGYKCCQQGFLSFFLASKV